MNHLTDNELEQLLKNYGSLTPSIPFTYRKKAIAWGQRIATVALVALLSLLLIALTVGIASRLDSANGDVPPIGTPLQPSDNSVLPSLPITTDRAPITTPVLTTPPPITTPPVTPPKPPKTEPPALEALLPAWYNGSSIQLVNFLVSSGTPDLKPARLEEVYNDYASFDLNLGSLSHSIHSGNLVSLNGLVDGHREDSCKGKYLRLSDGELICLGHELRDLWATVGIDPNSMNIFSIRYAAEDGERYVVTPTAPEYSGYFIYDRQASTLRKIPFDCNNSDSVSYSSNCRFIVVATRNKTNDLLNDLWLIDTSTMEIKQICAEYDTFGTSSFCADERFIYTYLRIGDSVEKNEYGEWAMYDTETGFTFCGKGEILYLQNGILVSRTPDGFLSYDCETGETPDDLSALPLVIDADQKSHRYTLTVYDSGTGEIVTTISNVGTYDISGDQQYLFYYVDKADGVVMADLFSGESVTLPVSPAFLAGADPDVGNVYYSMKVSADGSKIALGYEISIQDYMDQKQREINALRDAIHNGFLKTNSIPAFWGKFSAAKEQYAHLIEWTGYYIHEDYAIYMIAYQNNGYSLERSVGVLHVVEDYRSKTYCLYFASESPYSLGNLVARTTWENKVQLFRRTLNGNYDSTCTLLPTLGEPREFYFDYAKCYDASGKWSDDLKNAYIYGYEFLSTHTIKANANYSPEGLDQTLRIISKHPINTVRIGDLTIRRVADIVLYAPNGDQLLNVRITISSQGRYYLQHDSNLWYYGTEITEAEYMTLMETQGSILAKWGVYTDKRLAYVPWDGYIDAAYDFLPRGNLPIPNPIVNSEEEELAAANALAMIREGGYSSEEIIKTLFYYDHAYEYIFLLAEYNVEHSWRYSFRHTAPILIEIKNGVITLSDPSATAQ